MEAHALQLNKLLQHLGYTPEQADEISTNFFTSGEPTLPIDQILQQAQEYARPLLRSSLKREFSHEFKGQYMGEALNKIVAASKGKIRRVHYEDGNIERALSDLINLLEQGNGHETETAIRDLQDQLARVSAEKEEAVSQVHAQYAEKENARMVYDNLLAKITSFQQPGDGKVTKKLSIDLQHAAKAILRELSDEYSLKYDETLKDIALYDKTNPETPASYAGKPLAISELVEKALIRNNWIARSNGGNTAPAFVNRPKPHTPLPRTSDPSDFRKMLEAQIKE